MNFESVAMRGNWEGMLLVVTESCVELLVRERVEIFNPIYRAMFRWTSGLQKFADAFLRELKVRAEETSEGSLIPCGRQKFSGGGI